MTKQHPSDLSFVGKVSDGMRQLAEELHKSVIRKFEKQKIYENLKK